MTISRAVKDVGMKSYVIRFRALVSSKAKTMRVERSEQLLDWLHIHPDTVVIFSDKKIFTVDGHRNRQNDRYVAASPKDVKPLFRTKNPQSAMCLGVVGSDGSAMPLHWFEKKPGKKGVDSEHYLEVMEQVVLPWIEATYGERDICYVWQQDGAPCHTSHATQDWCEDNLQDFFKKDEWPPSSPDLNPLDYAFWGYLLKCIGIIPYPNLETMKKCVDDAWESLEAGYIQKTCAAFPKKMRQVIAASGGIIEK